MGSAPVYAEAKPVRECVNAAGAADGERRWYRRREPSCFPIDRRPVLAARSGTRLAAIPPGAALIIVEVTSSLSRPSLFCRQDAARPTLRRRPMATPCVHRHSQRCAYPSHVWSVATLSTPSSALCTVLT